MSKSRDWLLCLVAVGVFGLLGLLLAAGSWISSRWLYLEGDGVALKQTYVIAACCLAVVVLVFSAVIVVTTLRTWLAAERSARADLIELYRDVLRVDARRSSANPDNPGADRASGLAAELEAIRKQAFPSEP